jgi:cytochrome c peroxidase
VTRVNVLARLTMCMGVVGFIAACSNPADTAQEEPAIDGGDVAEVEPAVALVADLRLALFSPLPILMESENNPITLAKVNLGRKLFYDARLSRNHDVSCNTCHPLTKYGVDGLATSVGHLKQVGGRNAPTVYNAAGHIAHFWDGRAPDIEDQAKGPPLNPIEMAMPGEAVIVAVLNSIPGYVSLFAAAFPDDEEAISYDNMAKAIGAFERGLVTPTRFDDYLAGDNKALNKLELAGLTAFLDTGCHTCHTSSYVGGAMFQKLGQEKPWDDDEDQGRFDITGKEYDRQVFKVPSLRNVAETGPYFHDGSVKTLKEAVRLMADHQLGISLTDEEVISIISFLNSLTGDIDLAYIKRPELPESSESTPSPLATPTLTPRPDATPEPVATAT